MPARPKSYALILCNRHGGANQYLSADDCALIAAALDIVNPDDSEDEDAVGRARTLAEVFRRGAVA